MTTIELFNLGEAGIIADVPQHSTPPEAMTTAYNTLFTKRGVERIGGRKKVFGTLSGLPEYIMNLPGANGSYWIYTTLQKAFVYEGGIHTNITRQSGGVDVDYTTVDGRTWNSTILGGIPIINNGVDLPQYWTGLSPASKLANLTNWSATTRAKIIKAFGPYLIAMNLTEGSTIRPHAIMWSHKTDPGQIPSSWDYNNASVDAGQLELTDIEGGVIVDGVLLGNQLIIYKATAIHTLRFVGGEDIFSPDLLLANSGILAAKCACAFNKGTAHFVVTADDIIIHTGTKEGKSIVENRVRNLIFNDIDSINYNNSFVFENTSKNECWFCYPVAGATYPTIAAIWNYKDNTWTFSDAVNFVSAASGSITDAPTEEWDTDDTAWDLDTTPWANESRRQTVVVDRSKALQLNSGTDFDGVTPIAYIERRGLAVDSKDRTGKPRGSIKTVKLCTRMWLKVEGSVHLTVRMGAQEDYKSEVVWGAAQVFDSTTMQYLDWEVSGKLLAYRIEVASNDSWILEGIDLEIELLGNL